MHFWDENSQLIKSHHCSSQSGEIKLRHLTVNILTIYENEWIKLIRLWDIKSK